MADGLAENQWRHTSFLAATFVNMFRDAKKQPVQPAELNPHEQAKKRANRRPVTKDELAIMKTKITG